MTGRGGLSPTPAGGPPPPEPLLEEGRLLFEEARRAAQGVREISSQGRRQERAPELASAARALMRSRPPDLRFSPRPGQEGPQVLTWRIAVLGEPPPDGVFVSEAEVSEGESAGAYRNPSADTLFVNCFVRDDDDRIHSHGSSTASLMLEGALVEEWKPDPAEPGPFRSCRIQTGQTILRPSGCGHRLLLADGASRAVTLYAVGPTERVWRWYAEDGSSVALHEQPWGFWMEGEFVPFADTGQGALEREMALQAGDGL